MTAQLRHAQDSRTLHERSEHRSGRGGKRNGGALDHARVLLEGSGDPSRIDETAAVAPKRVVAPSGDDQASVWIERADVRSSPPAVNGGGRLEVGRKPVPVHDAVRGEQPDAARRTGRKRRAG